MADKQERKPRVRVIDAPGAAEVFADQIIGLQADASALTITFGVTRIVPSHLDEPPTVTPPVHVAGRVVLTPTAAAKLHGMLTNMLTHMTAQASPAEKIVEH